MSTIRIASRTKFARVPNATADDATISFRARGVLLFLLAKPDSWEANVEHIMANSDLEGKDAVRKAFNELIKAGYVTRTQLKENGSFRGYDYTVYDTVSGLSGHGFPEHGIPASGKSATNKTKSSKTKEIRLTNTTNVVEPKAHGNEEINKIVTAFNETFNVDHKQDRRYAQHFRRKFGVEVTLLMFAKTAEAQSQDKYCPRTPTLKDFWYQIPKLQDYFRRREQTPGITEIIL